MLEPGSTAGLGDWDGAERRVWGIPGFGDRPTPGMGSPHVMGRQGSAPRPGPPVFVLVWLRSVALP